MANNPWDVESIKDFYFLKCPECDFNTKEENSFENHATENHPLSFVLFDKKYVEEDFNKIDIKEDPLSQSDTKIPYDDKKSTFGQFVQHAHDNFPMAQSVLKTRKLPLSRRLQIWGGTEPLKLLPSRSISFNFTKTEISPVNSPDRLLSFKLKNSSSGGKL